MHTSPAQVCLLMLVDPVGAKEAARLEYERTHQEDSAVRELGDVELDYRREYRRTHVSGDANKALGLRPTRAQENTQRLAARRLEDYRRLNT